MDNKRIAKNTILLYVRMLFLMFVNLYTSRVVLQALGVEDFGVYNAVGGFVAMFSILSASLTTAISRFLTFYLGKKELAKLGTVFSTSVIIQLILCATVVILTETAGIWFLNNKMTIPEGREWAANWVLQFSMISFCINLLSTPYNAVLIAHERMSAFAYIGILEGVANLLIALLVLCSPGDKLIWYAALMCALALSIRMIYALYCKKHFAECSVTWRLDKPLLKEMFGFAGWNFLGSISGILRSQGINILFNVYNGPIVNAARGLAMQVNTAVTKFSGNFYMAVQPQITKQYAKDERAEACLLATRSARLAFFLLMMICLPLLFEINLVLKIWLTEVPLHTAAFVQIILVYSIIESFSQPLVYLMLATGDIKKYQLIVGSVNLMNFPVAWALLQVGCEPEIAQCSVIVFSIIALFCRVALLSKMVGFDAKRFLCDTVLRCICIFCIVGIVPAVINRYMDAGIVRFVVNAVVIELTACATIMTIGLKKEERAFAIRKTKEMIRKIVG